MTPSNAASGTNEARPQLFDPLAEEVGRFAAAWVNAENRIAAIDHLYRLLRLAREFPYPATERAIGAAGPCICPMCEHHTTARLASETPRPGEPRPCDCGSEKYRGVHIDSCTRTRAGKPTP